MRRGIPWLGEGETRGAGRSRTLASAEDTPRLPRSVATELLAVVTTERERGSLSEFYYHSNEDVERYFI